MGDDDATAIGGIRFEFARIASPDEVAECLTSIAHGLKRGEVTFTSAGLALRFAPSAGVVVELKASEKGEQGRLRVRIGWKARGKRDVSGLRISARSRAARGVRSRQAGPILPSSPTTPATRTGTILVIDGDEHPRRMLLDTLAAAGHAGTSAASGLEGLAQFRQGVFDVVVTALSMAECSGVDVARAVKKLSPATPVVLIAGWGDVMTPEQMRDGGIDLVLVKPFKGGRVLSVLADALALRHPH